MIHDGLHRLPGLLIVLAALLIPAGAAAHAQNESVLDLDDVTVSLHMPWPGSLSHGYGPLFVRIQNHGQRPAQVEIVADHSGQDQHRVMRTVAVESGRRTETVLLIPFYGSWSNYLSVRVEARGETRHASIQGTTMSHSRPDHSKILFFTDETPEAGKAEAWSARVGLEDSTPVAPSHTALHGLVLHGARRDAGYTAELIAVQSSDLVPRYQAYTGLDVVVIDTALERDPGNRFDGVLAWARMGGRVAFLGPGAAEFLRSLADVSSWMEERFEVVPSEQGFTAYRYGFGVVAMRDLDERALFDSDEACEVVNSLLGWQPQLDATSATESSWPIAVGGIEVPRRVLTAGLVLFVFLIWPVNFYLVRRWGRPVLVVLTVPLIAVVTSLGMLAYGTFYQGLDIKVATRSWTLLDQRSHRSSSAEFRQLFAGLRPGHGLLPQAGTCVIPQHQAADTYYWRNQRTRSFRTDLTEGTELSGDFLPPRQTANQMLLTESAARQRLFVQHNEDGTYRVENGLGARIERLVLKDPDGRYFGSDQAMDVGESLNLSALSLDDRAGHVATTTESWDTQTLWDTARCLVWRDDGRLAGLLPGTYAAVLSSNPWSDSTGLEMTHISGEHAVVGVLSLDGEEWR